MCPTSIRSAEPAVTALLLGGRDTDRPLLQDVFQTAGWKLLEAARLRDALARLRQDPIHVVIASATEGVHDWRRLLRRLRGLRRPPMLIVSSRNADEVLWSEVLNFGGYDVLAEPFDRDEVERVVAGARRHYDPPLARAAGSGSESAVA